MLKIEVVNQTYGNYQFLLNKEDIYEIHPHDTDPNAVVFNLKNYGNFSHGRLTVKGSFQFWEDVLEATYCIPVKK